VTLTAKDVAEITRLLEDSSFDELHLEIDGLKLSLRRSGAPPTRAALGTPAAVSMHAAEVDTPAAPRSARAGPVTGAGAQLLPAGELTEGTPAAPSAAGDPNAQAVTAPLLGTFYRAPKPGAPPFVEVGSAVEPDSIVGIIEVMKLMNTVRAGVRGTVRQIVARDGVLVEFGETLLIVGASA